MLPQKKKTGGTGITATAAAADAAAAPADAAAAPPEPYFGANGEATSRATSLPPLPGFEAFRGANSATAPPLLSTAAQSTATAAALPLSGPSGSV